VFGTTRRFVFASYSSFSALSSAVSRVVDVIEVDAQIAQQIGLKAPRPSLSS